MKAATLKVIEPGMLTTVQDIGRYGYQKYGVPVSGAMDEFALRAANILVGNDQSAAGLEITMLGPKLNILTDTWIAVTGANLTAQLDQKPVPAWVTVKAPKGSELTFQAANNGVRAYLGIAGGIDVPIVMGSRSTYIKGGLGGFGGRPLQHGDVLFALPTEDNISFIPRRLPKGYSAIRYGKKLQLRVILGPQHKAFTPETLSNLWNSNYVISSNSDRIGYRLQGAPITHLTSPDIISDGNPLGAIQVPGDGIPTILMADRGTTGGYTKIATVITADVGKLAQASPGESISFKPVNVEEALRAQQKKETVLKLMSSENLKYSDTSEELSISVDGKTYEIVGEDGEILSVPRPITNGSHTRSHTASATVDGQTYKFHVEIRRT